MKKYIYALIGALLLIGPYQNCALHQSEGRKQFEKLVASNSGVRPVGCSPFLSTNQAAVIMDDPFQTQVRFANSNSECLVSAEAYPPGFTAPTGLETAVCTLVPDLAIKNIGLPATPAAVLSAIPGQTLHANEVLYYVGHRSAVPPDSNPASDEFPFFGVVFEMASDPNSLKVVFFNQIDGLQCTFTVDKAQYDSSAPLKEEAARRGSLLVKAIEDNF